MANYITNPSLIEQTSFEIIENEVGRKIKYTGVSRNILKRVIHTSADYDYIDNLKIDYKFIEDFYSVYGSEELVIVTDTTMALSGINKKVLEKNNARVVCFIADEEVAKLAKEKNITRSMASVIHATTIKAKKIFVFGNAPTAIFQLLELVNDGFIIPKKDFVGVIGVPVGFVGATESKDLLHQSGIPHIVALGRKGGSNIAASIVNALIYQNND